MPIDYKKFILLIYLIAS